MPWFNPRMQREARIQRELLLEQEGGAVAIPTGPCRVEDVGDDFLLTWEQAGRTESMHCPTAMFEVLLRRHDIVFTSW